MVSMLTRSPISNPPTKVVEYEFSYSRSTGMFRWRHGKKLCDRCKQDVSGFGGPKEYLPTGFIAYGKPCPNCKDGFIPQHWLCKSIAGDVWCRRSDGVEGHLYLVCELYIDTEGNATVWPPEGVLLEGLKAERIVPPQPAADSQWADFPQGRRAHWRLCLNRQMKAWRIRDEAVPNKIWNTNGYRGIININWLDSGPHIHADQEANIDTYGVVHFNG